MPWRPPSGGADIARRGLPPDFGRERTPSSLASLDRSGRRHRRRQSGNIRHARPIKSVSGP